MYKYFNVEIDMAGKFRIRCVNEDDTVDMLKFDNYPTLEQINTEYENAQASKIITTPDEPSI